jgi:hypothetical protein
MSILYRRHAFSAMRQYRTSVSGGGVGWAWDILRHGGQSEPPAEARRVRRAMLTGGYLPTRSLHVGIAEKVSNGLLRQKPNRRRQCH